MSVDVALPVERPGSAKVQAHAEKLRAAVEGAMAEFGAGVEELGDPEVQSAITEWKAQLDSHVAGLQSIMQQNGLSPSGDQTLASPLASSVAAEEMAGEVDNVRSMRHEIEAERTGRDVEDVASAWADPEETEKEMAELRRVRRQIRYLFGGVIGAMPDNPTNLRVSDLISDNGDTEPLTAAPPAAPQSAAGYGGQRMAPRPPGDAQGSPNRPPNNNQNAGYAGRMPEARPRSGGGDSIGGLTNSSVATFNSQSTQREPENEEDRRRRAERREQKKQRAERHQREQRSVDAPRDIKRDNGPMPPASKQWNWAEEVVKASLDPGNQWEFPGVDDGRGAVPRKGQPQWEQPRQVGPRGPGLPGQRGNDVALKARERAEEIMRSEQDRQRNRYDPSDDMLLGARD